MASQQPQDLRQMYHHIIDDVVAKMKPGFLQESVDESVLQTIRQRWSQKLIEKGIITEPEARQEAVVKKDEDPASRKRPYDGSAPNSRQEAAAAAAAAAAGVGMPIKGPTPHMMLQARPAGQPLAAGIPGMRTAHPGTQIPLARALPGVPAALAAGQQQHTGLPPGLQQLHGLSQHNIMLQTALARVNGLPPQQRQQALQMQLHALQQGHLQGQAMVAGIPGQHQVPGMQPNQGLPAGQQLQGMAGLRAQGIPHQGFPQQALQQQGLTQQGLQQQGLQQQGLQQQGLQQQGLRLPGMPGAMPAAGVQQATALQGLMPQALMQQQRIPQGDGSADLPPSIAEVAAAAGMQPEQLRAILPPRIAAIMERGSVGSSALGSMQASTAGPGQAGAAGDVAAAAAAGVTGRGRASPGSTLQQRRRPRRVIPQVDGGGDEEDYGDDEEDDGDDAGEDAAAADEAEEEEEEEEDESDDPEMAKFTADLDALEEADKVETGDVGFALYEKVHRAKNRWRCNLRYGVFLINGKEYMFNKGTTDFTF